MRSKIEYAEFKKRRMEKLDINVRMPSSLKRLLMTITLAIQLFFQVNVKLHQRMWAGFMVFMIFLRLTTTLPINIMRM
jgi:hypothetical protein